MSICPCNFFTVMTTFANSSINTNNVTGSSSNTDTAAISYSTTDTSTSTSTNRGPIPGW